MFLVTQHTRLQHLGNTVKTLARACFEGQGGRGQFLEWGLSAGRHRHHLQALLLCCYNTEEGGEQNGLGQGRGRGGRDDRVGWLGMGQDGFDGT